MNVWNNHIIAAAFADSSFNTVRDVVSAIDEFDDAPISILIEDGKRLNFYEPDELDFINEGTLDRKIKIHGAESGESGVVITITLKRSR